MTRLTKDYLDGLTAAGWDEAVSEIRRLTDENRNKDIAIRAALDRIVSQGGDPALEDWLRDALSATSTDQEKQ